MRDGWMLAGICLLGAVLHVSGADFTPFDESSARALVVISEDTNATSAFAPNKPVVQQMVDGGLLKLTGKKDLRTAWLQYVSPTDVVAIKVFSRPGGNSGTRPAVVEAVVQGLLAAGLPPTSIIIWDKRMVDLQGAGYGYLADQYHVGLQSSAQAGYDPRVAYTNSILGTLVAGDLDFDQDGATTGRRSYLTKLVTRTATKLISIAPLLNNNWAGVSGNLYSVAMGSIDNSLRFENDEKSLAQAVPEIYAFPQISDHCVLNITDALIGQYEGEETSLLHYSTTLNQIWISTDPVALDSLASQELDRERQANNLSPLAGNHELLQNAALLQLGVADLNRIRLDIVKPGSGDSTNLPLRQIAPGVFQLGSVRLDKTQHTVSFPAEVNMNDGLVEYLLVSGKGKTYESLLKTDAQPYDIQLAMLLLGAKGAPQTPALLNAPSVPFHVNSAHPPEAVTGAPILIDLSWKSGEDTHHARAEDWILDLSRKATAAAGPWTYNGSRVQRGVFIAQRDGQVVALIDDIDAMINNPRPGHDNDQIWEINSNAIPPLRTPVEVTFALQP